MTTLAKMAAYTVRRDAIAARATPGMLALPSSELVARMKRNVASLPLHHATVGDVLEAKPAALLRVVSMGEVALSALYDLLDRIATEMGCPESPPPAIPNGDGRASLIESEVALAIGIRKAFVDHGAMSTQEATVLTAAVLQRMPRTI